MDNICSGENKPDAEEIIDDHGVVIDVEEIRDSKYTQSDKEDNFSKQHVAENPVLLEIGKEIVKEMSRDLIKEVAGEKYIYDLKKQK